MLNCNLKRHKSKGVGKLKCRICGISFETKINNLFAQADVYCAWMDELDRLESERKVLEKREKELMDEDKIDVKNEDKIEKIEKEDESSDDENYYNHNSKKSESKSSFNEDDDDDSDNDSLEEVMDKQNLKKLKQS